MVADLRTVSSCVCGNQKSTSKALLQKTCQQREFPGIPQDGTLPFCPMAVLLPLTCLPTPNPVASPYRCYVADTAHVHIASCVDLALILKDEHNRLQTDGGYTCQPSYICEHVVKSQYIYIRKQDKELLF